LALRAVVFDYGMVLSGPQDPQARAQLLSLTGLPVEQFDRLYWADRPAYDLGRLTGIAFWQKLCADAGLSRGPAAIEELNRWDARLWTTENSSMLAWQKQVKQRGLRTAILSNMGDAVLANIEREFAWLPDFDVLVWSYQLGLIKPDPAIYRYTLEKLGTRPEETFFLDDRPENVESARKLGMTGLVFTDVKKLRDDLVAAGLDAELPLPE